MLVSIYRTKPNAHQAPGGYWFLRIENGVTSLCTEIPITPAKADELQRIGTPRLEDGGGYG
jgi:hypothetical protein